jgi:hypothetical protein
MLLEICICYWIWILKMMKKSLPLDYEEKVDKALMQPNLRGPKKIGHEFVHMLTLNGLNFEGGYFLIDI